MNVCFAVQEMNVPMSQYIEWPITSFMVQLRLVRRAAGASSPNCFTSLCTPSQAPCCSDGCKSDQFHFVAKASSIRCISICYQQIRGSPTKFPHEWIDSMSAYWNLKPFWRARKWWLPESEHQSAYSTLTNWFHVRYKGGKKNLYLLYTVYGMYCICKDKSNRVLQEDVLVWGCMKRRDGSQLKRN